jgi:arginase
MKKIVVIEFPSNLGLIEPSKGIEPGVKKLPSWLRKHGFYELVNPQKIFSLEPPSYTMNVDEESGVRNADSIARYANQQANLLNQVLEENMFPVVIGGDCSILIGNSIALRRAGNYGLFFLDGHTDFGWPELSKTAGAAGMDLAIVTGQGHPKLTNIFGLSPYFLEQNVWCVGNRDFDEVYVKVITNSAINYFDLSRLRQWGISRCCNDFLGLVARKKLDGFWIHFDVDVLDDELMPAVDSRETGGLSFEEMKEILGILLDHEKAAGIEITILDPDLDPGGVYTKRFVHEMGEIFALRNENPEFKGV